MLEGIARKMLLQALGKETGPITVGPIEFVVGNLINEHFAGRACDDMDASVRELVGIATDTLKTLRMNILKELLDFEDAKRLFLQQNGGEDNANARIMAAAKFGKPVAELNNTKAEIDKALGDDNGQEDQ